MKRGNPPSEPGGRGNGRLRGEKEGDSENLLGLPEEFRLRLHRSSLLPSGTFRP